MMGDDAISAPRITASAAELRLRRGFAVACRRQPALSLTLGMALGLSTAGCGLNRASSRIAFMGDSITQGWTLPRVNLGVHGQTTGEMLARFPAQVLGHGYTQVIILGGTNDVLLKIPAEVTVANLGRMVDLARQAGIEPTVCEIPPIFLTDRDYHTPVAELNRRIVALAANRKIKLVDYYDAIDHHPNYSSDGVHFKRRGYFAMERALLHVESPF
jgi:lysophospholipase L1-like esterase